jgi:hypothetical protein
MVSEVSVHSHLVQLLWTDGEAEHQWHVADKIAISLATGIKER